MQKDPEGRESGTGRESIIENTESAGASSADFLLYKKDKYDTIVQKRQRGETMLFEDICILDEDFSVREHQYVAVEGETVTYIGSEKP